MKTIVTVIELNGNVKTAQAEGSLKECAAFAKKMMKDHPEMSDCASKPVQEEKIIPVKDIIKPNEDEPELLQKEMLVPAEEIELPNEDGTATKLTDVAPDMKGEMVGVPVPEEKQKALDEQIEEILEAGDPKHFKKDSDIPVTDEEDAAWEEAIELAKKSIITARKKGISAKAVKEAFGGR